MKFKIDNLQYCNWSREIFEINRKAGLDAVHVTIVYHEDFHELLDEIKKSAESYNHKLAGQIEKEIGYTEESRNKLIP